jgi:16S rRNA (guanine(966)-N(2))-methyltransferase RsmD
MRIIRGNHRGRQINPPKNLPVRPTTDLAKESLFNILDHEYYFEELSVLDLFAGTGSISYEFASRGAREIISVDINPKCIHFIKSTAELLDFSQINSVRATALAYLRTSRKKFDVIFADPPYDLGRLDELVELIFGKELLDEEGVFVMEHSKDWDFKELKQFHQQKKYGRVHFSFFRHK